MIGFVRNFLIDLVLEPQSDEAMGERRAFLDPESRPLDVEAQEIDLLGLSTAPVSYEIGGGMELRHTISAAVEVAHGDPAEAIRLRDAIVLDLVLRCLDNLDAIYALRDPATGQYATRVEWTVDYRPFTIDTPNENATITFTVDTTLDR